jgi:hypothetical protein
MRQIFDMEEVMFKLLRIFKPNYTIVKCVRSSCAHNKLGKCKRRKVNFDYGKGIGFVCKDFDFE